MAEPTHRRNLVASLIESPLAVSNIRTMRRLHIFATEIAGLTGRHQYQPVAEVAAKIRERFHGIAAPVAPCRAAANLLRSDRPVEPDATEDTLPDILPSVEKVTNQLQGEIDQLAAA